MKLTKKEIAELEPIAISAYNLIILAIEHNEADYIFVKYNRIYNLLNNFGIRIPWEKRNYSQGH